MSTNSMPVVGPKTDSKDWIGFRLFEKERTPQIVFGASSSGQLTGFSSYGGQPDFYLTATGVLPPFVPEDTAMRLGKMLEPVIMQEYTNRTGNVCTVGHPMYLHHEKNFIGCTPDGMTMEYGKRVVVDGKSSNWRMIASDGDDDQKFGQDGSDEIPAYYMMQAQQQMYVMDCDVAHYPTLFDGRNMRIYRVARNEQLIQTIVDSETEMLRCLNEGVCPPIDYYHKNAQKVIRELHNVDMEDIIELPVEMEKKWEQVRVWSETIKAFEKEMKATKAEIQDFMGSHGIAYLPSCPKQQIKQVTVNDSHWQQDELDGLELYALLNTIAKGNDLAPGRLENALSRYREQVLSRAGTIKKRGNRHLREVKRKEN